MTGDAARTNIPVLNWFGLTPAQFLKRSILTLALFSAAGMAGSAGLPLVVLAYVVFLVVVNKPVFEAFHSREATEWLLGLAFSRRSLARRYVAVLVLRSAVHTAAIVFVTPLFSVSNPSEELWSPPTDVASAFALLFACHVTFQCIVAMIRHLEFCTWVPARWRDSLLGCAVSRWQSARGRIMTNIIGILILLFPPFLCGALGAAFWIGLPAAGYLALTFGMVASSEAARGTKAGRSALVRRVVSGPSHPVMSFRAVPHRFAPLTALCWIGLKPWVKQVSWGCPLLCEFAVAITLALSNETLNLEAWKVLQGALVTGVGAAVVVYLIRGFDAFAWHPFGPTAEYLYTRGVPLGTLRRLRLLLGVLTVGLVFSYTLFILWMADRLTLLSDMGQEYWGILLIPTGLLLLGVNEERVGWRAVRAKHLSGLFLAAIPFFLCLGWLLASVDTQIRFLLAVPAFWNVAGLAVFLPAMGLWIRGWKRSANEDSLRWDTWRA